ncbi:hypothetical protein VNO77_39316 [Canavalia gladiata]|uniref:Uncharacterized protein n=1 Tax=Canavalia gladiata TaxID=3824 RepID=A0AAN9PX11_CANGL
MDSFARGDPVIQCMIVWGGIRVLIVPPILTLYDLNPTSTLRLIIRIQSLNILLKSHTVGSYSSPSLIPNHVGSRPRLSARNEVSDATMTRSAEILGHDELRSKDDHISSLMLWRIDMLQQWRQWVTGLLDSCFTDLSGRFLRERLLSEHYAEIIKEKESKIHAYISMKSV